MNLFLLQECVDTDLKQWYTILISFPAGFSVLDLGVCSQAARATAPSSEFSVGGPASGIRNS